MQNGQLYYGDLLSDGENAVWTAVNDDKTAAVTTIAVKDYVLYAYPHRVYVEGLKSDEKYDVYEVGTPEYTEKYLFTTTGRNLRVLLREICFSSRTCKTISIRYKRECSPL